MPVSFGFFRYESKKYKLKKVLEATGPCIPSAPSSTFSVTYKFPKKGKWMVGVLFMDEAHPDGIYKQKKITIK
jgi:hypothetical protein